MGIDVVVALLLFIAFFRGFSQGFIMALFTLAAYAAGFFLTMRLSFYTSGYLADNFNIPGQWLPVISFIVTFSLLVLGVKWLGKLFESVITKIVPSVLNRLLGAALYVSVVFVLAGAFYVLMAGGGVFKPGLVESSVTAPYLLQAGTLVEDHAGDALPVIRRVFSAAEQYFSGLAGLIPSL